MVLKPWVIATATLAACVASAPSRVPVANERLDATDGAVHGILPVDPDAYTVLVFFSTECHVLALHDERVRKLAAEYAPRGIRFLAVDSEVGASLDHDRAEVERRRYPFPIALDRGGQLARSLGAEYAGYVIVVDREGQVRYRGGIDSDRIRLRDDTSKYLSDALSDLLAGKSPRIAESKALGCALRLR